MMNQSTSGTPPKSPSATTRRRTSNRLLQRQSNCDDNNSISSHGDSISTISTLGSMSTLGSASASAAGGSGSYGTQRILQYRKQKQLLLQQKQEQQEQQQDDNDDSRSSNYNIDTSSTFTDRRTKITSTTDNDSSSNAKSPVTTKTKVKSASTSTPILRSSLASTSKATTTASMKKEEDNDSNNMKRSTRNSSKNFFASSPTTTTSSTTRKTPSSSSSSGVKWEPSSSSSLLSTSSKFSPKSKSTSMSSLLLLSSTRSSSSSSSSPLELTVQPRHNSIVKSSPPSSRSSTTTQQVCATIQARHLHTKQGIEHRAPIDIVIALDVSNSMNDGSKLDLCKRTLHLLLNTLTPSDRFGLVSYASTAQVDIQTKFCTPSHKQYSLKVISQLSVRNKTNISEAISLASQEIHNISKKQKQKASSSKIKNKNDGVPNSVRTVFLLTDGLATEGIKTDEYLIDIVHNCILKGKTLLNSNQSDTLPWLMNNAKSDNPEIPKYKEDATTNESSSSMVDDAASHVTSGSNKQQQHLSLQLPPVTLHTFGYGKDHNAKLLGELAATTRDGSYYFVNNEQDVSTAFGDALGGVLSVVAQNVMLTITPSTILTTTAPATSTPKKTTTPKRRSEKKKETEKKNEVVSPRLSSTSLTTKPQRRSSPPTIQEEQLQGEVKQLPAVVSSSPAVVRSKVVTSEATPPLTPTEASTDDDDAAAFRSPPTSLSGWKSAFEVQAAKKSPSSRSSIRKLIKSPPLTSPTSSTSRKKRSVRASMTNDGKPKKSLDELKQEYQSLLRSSSSNLSSSSRSSSPSLSQSSKGSEEEENKDKSSAKDEKPTSSSTDPTAFKVATKTKNSTMKKSSHVDETIVSKEVVEKKQATASPKPTTSPAEGLEEETKKKQVTSKTSTSSPTKKVVDGTTNRLSKSSSNLSDKEPLRHSSSSSSTTASRRSSDVDSSDASLVDRGNDEVGKVLLSPPQQQQQLKHRVSKIYRDDQVIEENDDGSFSVSVGDFYAEEVRDVLFEIDVANFDGSIVGSSPTRMPLVNVSLSFWDTIQRQMVSTDPVTCSIDRPTPLTEGATATTTSDATENPHVQKQWLRVSAASAMKAAQVLAHKGDLLRAREKIKSWQTMCEEEMDGSTDLILDPMVGQLLDDMEECYAGLASKAAFEEFGNKTLQTRYQTHVSQRSSECNLQRNSVYRGSHKTKLAELFSSHSTITTASTTGTFGSSY